MSIEFIKQAAALLLEDQLVAFPTETVYGLGARLFSPKAIQRIFEIKKRPQDNPLIVHISSFDQIDRVVDDFPEKLAAHFWPGPLTLILPKKKYVPDAASAGLDKIGIRMPSHPLALELIETVGEPLVAPSANLSGRPSSTTAEHVRDDFGDKIMVLEGGASPQGIESTILAFDPPTILRPGNISKEEIEAVIGQKVLTVYEKTSKPLAPGMKYKHYAPQAKIHLTETYPSISCSSKQLFLESIKPEELYAVLREADKKGIEEIIIYCSPAVKANAALFNRLFRAAE
ncbi:MAG: L-threonylcarbamoyladenylate synthase [Chlamydiales bacterium]